LVVGSAFLGMEWDECLRLKVARADETFTTTSDLALVPNMAPLHLIHALGVHLCCHFQHLLMVEIAIVGVY
jgi:hypothetical protein